MRHIHQLRFWGLILLFVSLTVSANVIVNALESKHNWRFDLTASRLTRLSNETCEAVDALNEDVYIHLLFRSSTQSKLRTTLEELTAKYRSINPHVIVDVIDPVTQPGRILQLVENTSELTEGSILVTNASETRVKTIYAGELYNYSYNSAAQEYKQSSFVGESKLTSALIYVSAAASPKVYMLTGHGEVDLSYSSIICHELENNNYDVSSLELNSDSILCAGDTVVIVAPTLDLTDSEYKTILSWLENGGRLFFCNDATIDINTLPNFSKLLAYYGISLPYRMVVEDINATSSYIESTMYIVPKVNGQSRITSSLTAGRMIMPFAGPVELSSVEQPGFETQILLTASATSYAKMMHSMDNFLIRELNDANGPFTLAVSMARVNADGNETRLIAMNDVYTFIDSNYLYSSNNLEYTMNCFKFLIDKETTIYIRSKALASNLLQLPNEKVRQMLTVLVCGIIPGVVLTCGLFVYIRRRKT